ncbi:uncharacterized protein [Solanum lycopersicum]|uniref:Uncharacterized protein n=1 Tax=Solanum lycopersicum TaxID=4081 RepID=A0A3Q7HUX6_SOLLC|nr:uncharacterized protein LOC101253408 [Solanum lycopersicum]
MVNMNEASCDNPYCHMITKACNKRCYNESFSSPMPMIGIYVAAASLLCILAMAADAFQAFRVKRLWFPCKFFALNAASLTVLAVAMKLPVEISEPMPGHTDQLSKLASTVFMCVVIGNFMPSIGAMSNKEILSNVVALDILVITIIVNLFIEMHTGLIVNLKPEFIATIFLMFLLILVLSFSSLTLATTKKILELNYKEAYQITLRNDALAFGRLSIDRLRDTVEKCWMMVETSNPQFVMARSVTFSTSGTICVLASLILMEALIRIYNSPPYFPNSSTYEWTTSVILIVQSIGVVVGTVAPALRWFICISFKRSNKTGNANANFFKVEDYWIRKLVEWKEKPLSLNIRGTKFRKYLQGTRNLILAFSIRSQILVVSMSKFVRFVSVVSFNLMFLCQLQGPNYHQSEPEHMRETELHHYVLLLEGEEELPERIFKNISGNASRLVDTGRKRQPTQLVNLLRKSSSFSGVADIYCHQVPVLHSVEPSNCWTISLVTLTSITVALPKVRDQMDYQLIRSVHEGLTYASFIEETMYPEGEFTNIRNAAHIVWEELEIHQKWLDEDLQKPTLEGKTPRETLEMLTGIASKKVMDFKQTTDGRILDNPLNWPVRIIAANSMYKIGKAILLLLHSEGHNGTVHEKLFERLSITIADILSACFTNLPRAITMACNSGAIEDREKNVHRAALLVGKTEEILKIIQYHELPNINADQSAYIDQSNLTLQPTNLVPVIPFNSEIQI